MTHEPSFVLGSALGSPLPFDVPSTRLRREGAKLRWKQPFEHRRWRDDAARVERRWGHDCDWSDRRH